MSDFTDFKLPPVGEWKHIPAAGKVVAMTEFRGRIIVACENGVYELDSNVLRRMERERKF